MWKKVLFGLIWVYIISKVIRVKKWINPIYENFLMLKLPFVIFCVFFL